MIRMLHHCVGASMIGAAAVAISKVAVAEDSCSRLSTSWICPNLRHWQCQKYILPADRLFRVTVIDGCDHGVWKGWRMSMIHWCSVQSLPCLELRVTTSRPQP